MGELVLMYRDHESRRVCPHKVIAVNNKVLKVDYGEQLAQFSLYRCKLYRIDEEFKNLTTDQNNLAELQIRDQEDERSRHERYELQNNFWDIPKGDEDPFDIHLVHVPEPSDSGTQKHDFLIAKN